MATASPRSKSRAHSATRPAVPDTYYVSTAKRSDDSTASPEMSLTAYLNNVYAVKKSLKKSAVYIYGLGVRSFNDWYGSHVAVSQLTDVLVNEWLRWLDTTTFLPDTIRHKRSILTALWDQAARDGLCRKRSDKLHDPAPKPVTEKARRTEPLVVHHETTLRDFFHEVMQREHAFGGVPAGLWWRALHEVMWWTGERIGALMQLRWSDYEAESGWLVVPAQTRKFGRADKATRLPPSAMATLKLIEPPHREPIFPWPLCRSSLWLKYKVILKRAGLPHDRKSGFHRMRRTVASYFEQCGGNSTDLLGHSDRNVTRGYLDPRIATPPQAADTLFLPGTVADDGSDAKGGAAYRRLWTMRHEVAERAFR